MLPARGNTSAKKPPWSGLNASGDTEPALKPDKIESMRAGDGVPSSSPKLSGRMQVERPRSFSRTKDRLSPCCRCSPAWECTKCHPKRHIQLLDETQLQFNTNIIVFFLLMVVELSPIDKSFDSTHTVICFLSLANPVSGLHSKAFAIASTP